MNWLGRCFKAALLCAALSAAADTRVSGTTFLSPQLQSLQLDASRNPAQLWIERGQTVWQAQCASCHGQPASLKKAVASYPKLSAAGKLVNLEDQIAHHQHLSQLQSQQQNQPRYQSQRTPVLAQDDVLALSAALHDAAVGERIKVLSLTPALQPHLDRGLQLWSTRMGRINLACAHCHDQKVGTQMRADTISQGHPTGFPIYRLSWQALGSLERRLRACYSGVQAPLPAIGSTELRELELFLKVRANGMTMDGPSIRR